MVVYSGGDCIPTPSSEWAGRQIKPAYRCNNTINVTVCRGRSYVLRSDQPFVVVIGMNAYYLAYVICIMIILQE